MRKTLLGCHPWIHISARVFWLLFHRDGYTTQLDKHTSWLGYLAHGTVGLLLAIIIISFSSSPL